MSLYKISTRKCLNIYQRMKKNLVMVNHHQYHTLERSCHPVCFFSSVHQKCRQKLRSLCEKLKVCLIRRFFLFIDSFFFSFQGSRWYSYHWQSCSCPYCSMFSRKYHVVVSIHSSVRFTREHICCFGQRIPFETSKQQNDESTFFFFFSIFFFRKNIA